jgi:tRNA1Val (adenine37-N6)-methyltransferase
MTAAIAMMNDELTDDALTGRVRVYQRRHGHRYSLDDVATAWVALTQCGALPKTCLDLGCGLGSVLLMLADKLPEAQLFGLEAQEISHALAVRNIERNGLGERVRAELGDLRDERTLASLRAEPAVELTGGFQLVTGTPPYKPVGTATPSPDSQRAHARVELRGGVEAYLLAASRVLAADGLCVVCAEAGPGTEQRVQTGAALAGLHVVSRMDVIPMQARTSKGRLFSVHTLALTPSAAAPVVLPPLVARDAEGARTEASRELRRFFGLESSAGELPSPTLRVRRGES